MDMNKELLTKLEHMKKIYRVERRMGNLQGVQRHCQRRKLGKLKT